MKHTEILKLKKMLEEAKIPFKFIRREDLNGYHLVYPSHEKIICSVIEHDYSFGNASDLVEIKGLLTAEEAEHSITVGWLTAEDVFSRIIQHYKNNCVNTDETKLKPCPFCGFTASIETFKVRKGYEANVHCNNCLANMPTITFDTEEEAYYQAVTDWNTRSSKYEETVKGDSI